MTKAPTGSYITIPEEQRMRLLTPVTPRSRSLQQQQQQQQQKQPFADAEEDQQTVEVW